MFLNKAILVEILKTYPGSEYIEDKYRSQIKTAKTGGSIWIQSTEKAKKLLGFNNNESSEAAYLELRALIDEATDRNNPFAWAKILCVSGEAAHKTLNTSYYGSELCNSAFALRAYIVYKIDEKIKSIKSTKTLDEDQKLALQIKEIFERRIQRNIETIRLLGKASANIEFLQYGMILDKRFPINVDEIQSYQSKSSEIVEIAQRHLYFLGYDSQTDLSLKPPMELFPRYPYYNNKDFVLSRSSIEGLKLHLPMFLQPIYIAVHLRNKRPNLKSEINETAVIASFEQQVEVRIKEEQKIQEAIRIKKIADEDESQKMLADLPTIPERDDTDVPILDKLETPSTPKQQLDAMDQSPKKEMKYPISGHEIDQLNANGSLTLIKVPTPKNENSVELNNNSTPEIINPEMTKSYVFFTPPTNKAPIDEEMKKNEKSKKKNVGGNGSK